MRARKDCARPKVEEEGDADWGGGAWGERRGTTGVACPYENGCGCRYSRIWNWRRDGCFTEVSIAQQRWKALRRMSDE